MKSILIFILIILSVDLSAAENFKIYGVVRDSHSQEPIVGANVYVENTSFGAATDQDGIFSFEINGLKSSHTLIVSYVGYHDYHLKITFPLTENKQLDISLKESAIMMDQIVVTGTRSERMLKHSPVTTQVINQKKIQETGASDLAEVLERVTGVTVTSNTLGTGTSTVELQGFGSNHVLVMVDGVKMIGRVRGELDISQIPTSQIERVEIVKGSTSTLYGSEAMGGVINIITKMPEKKLDVNTSAQIGSYGKVNTSIDIGGSVDGWLQKANFNYRKSSGYDLDKSTPAWNGTAFNKYHANYSVSKKFGDNLKVQTILNYFQEDQRAVADRDFETIVDNRYITGRVGVENQLQDNFKITMGVEYAYSNHDQDKKVIRSGSIVNEKPTIENLGKGELLFDWSVDNTDRDITQRINGGYSYESEYINTDRITGNGQKSNSLHNFFVQDEVKLDQFTLSPGFRMDDHSAYGTHFSPKLSAMYSPAYNIRFRASYGTGFRAPSFKELYWNYYSSIGYWVHGNPNLEPENSKSYNIGAEFWTDKDYHSRLNFFYNTINNLIDFRFTNLVDGVSNYTMANIDGAKTWGAEWDMEYYPNEWFETSLGYYYLDSKDDLTNQPLQLKPKHRANLKFTFKLPLEIRFSITSQITDKKFYFDSDDPASQQKHWLEGYTLFHTDLSVPIIKHVNLNFGVKNISDYVNKEWGPMPGREYYATINTNF